MRNYILYFFLFFANCSFTQSKNERIESLTFSRDSLIRELKLLNYNFEKKISFNDSIFNLKIEESESTINHLNSMNLNLKKQIDSLNKENLNSITNEIEKWKKELFLNGEVGPPCIDDYEKWTEENPSFYWGIEEIVLSLYDFNKDGVNDALAFFPAVNCVGGNGSQSDFAIFIYSNNTNLLSNKKINQNIEDKIAEFFHGEGIYDVYRSKIEFKGLNSYIQGNFNLWVEDDPNCCPSYSGNFKYNPLTIKIEINYWKNE